MWGPSVLLFTLSCLCAAQDFCGSIQPKPCMADSNCFWCGQEGAPPSTKQCFSRQTNNCDNMTCTGDKFCEQNSYITDNALRYYTENECIVNKNCSYIAQNDFVYGWCTDRWGGGGWQCECITHFSTDYQCKVSFYEIWENHCVGLVVVGWIFWISLFVIMLPEFIMDSKSMAMGEYPLEYMIKIFLLLIPILRFVWLGLFTRSCSDEEPHGDFVGSGFYSMSTVFVVIVMILMPAFWADLVIPLQPAPTIGIEHTLAKVYGFVFAPLYFIIGLILTILQPTHYYDTQRSHGPLFFDNLNGGFGVFFLLIAWIWLLVAAILDRPIFDESDRGKALKYKNTAVLVSGAMFIIALVLLFIYLAVTARRDPWAYLGMHSVIEVGLAIFLFIIWIVVQRYSWGENGCCVLGGFATGDADDYVAM